MRFDLEVTFDIEGDYTPGTQPQRGADGTWMPGESPQCDIRVLWGSHDVTGLMTAQQLMLAEDAWIEHNETVW